MTTPLSIALPASPAATPTTGIELLAWAESMRMARPRRLGVWWCLWGWGLERGYPGLIEDWDREMVKFAWSEAVLWMADTRTQASGGN